MSLILNRIQYFLQVLFLLFFLAFVCPPDANAESRIAFGGHWEGRIVEKLVFDESGPYSKQELYRLIQIQPGDLYQARLVREATKRLYQTEQFKSVWMTVEPIGERRLSLKIHWVKNLLLTAITFSGNHKLSDEVLLKTMAVKPGDWFSEPSFKNALQNIRTHYRKAGYFQAKVSSTLNPSSGKQAGVDVLLEIDEGGRTKIGKMVFSGDKVFSNWKLRLKIYSNEGEYYLFDELQKDLGRLKQFYEAEGYFRVIIGPTAISYNEAHNEVDVVITIQSFNHLSVFFEGKKLYDEDKLESLILIKKERNVSQDVLEGSARQITNFYLSEGYPFAKTQARLKKYPLEKRAEVYFLIESGRRTKIDDIQFSGHYAFLSKILLKQIALEKSKIFSNAYYIKEEVETAAKALTLFYKVEGFQSVSVTPEVRLNKKRTSATLLFEIDEGPRTRFRSITFEGNQALDAKDLKVALDLFPQEPFTLEKVRDGRRTLLNTYAKKGYLEADISPELQFSLHQTDADVMYHVAEGPQTFFGQIVLKGNQFTRDEVILRALRVKTGEPYSPVAILESQRHLYKTGYFSSVGFDPQVKLGREEGEKNQQDIALTVVEKPRIVLDFGVGYGDRERARGLVEISHQNIWGSGQSLSARLERSQVEERYFLVYRKPWFFDESITARITASYFDLEEVSFDLETFSVVAGLEKEFSERFKGALLYQIEQKRTSNVEGPANITSEDESLFTIGTLNPSVVYDTRKNKYNPRKGSVSSLVIRDAAKILGSEVQFVKATVQNRSYFTIFKNIVFAFSTRAGVAERFGVTEIIPLSERFFVGGRNTVRGYDEDKLGLVGETLQDLEDASGAILKKNVPIGGNAMLVLNEELRLTLPKSFGLVLFFDHGNVWRTYKDVEFKEIKSTVGLGLRYNTPIGPFRLDWGYKLNREEGESPSAFHFSLGHAF